MKTYIYGKIDPNEVPYRESNEFHTLFMFLGAYLIYSETSTKYNDFTDYVNRNHLLYEDTHGKCYWRFINKAQAFIRDKINNSVFIDKKNHVSKRQIRKLGFSAFGSVRMYPLNGKTIQEELFNFVFGKQCPEQVRNMFLDYLSKKWREEEYPHAYLTINSGVAATENTFRTFISFQYAVLVRSPIGRRIIPQLSANNTYMQIRSELDQRW